MKTGSSIRLFLLVPGNLLALFLACLGAVILKTNLLGWFLVLLGAGYIVGGVFFIWPKNTPLLIQTGRTEREEEGDRSFWLLVPGFVVVFFASPVEYLFLGAAARAGLAVQIAGLALVSLGVALRIWTRVTLKNQYTGHIQTFAGGVLETGGPYRYLRHPGYAGYLLVGIGLSVGLGSYIGLASTFVLLLPGLFYRMCVEEELLTAQFGDEYLEYAVRTKRLIPGVW